MKWVILYEDGSTPQIHHMLVEAQTLSEAIDKSGVHSKHVFAGALYGHLGAASASLLQVMNLGVIAVNAR